MEPQELGAWFEKCAGPLVLYARQWVGGGLAEDVVQEVFLRLVGRERQPENVRAWLFAAVRNEVIDEHRAGFRRAQRERAAGMRPEAYFAAETLDQEMEARRVEEALKELPGEGKEIVVLRIWGGLKFQEIADMTGMPLSTVHSQYKNALGLVKLRLEKPCRTMD